MKYFTLTLHGLAAPGEELAEQISAIAWTAGCSGIEEPQEPPITPGLAEPFPDSTALPQAALPEAAQVWRIFFAERPTAEACREALSALLPGAGADGVRMEIEAREPENWMAGWRDYFHPVRVGESFVIAPPWRDVDEDQSCEGRSQARAVIRIEPGMAFGTGTHATTQLCLELAEPHLRPGLRVLDVGTGSGILAIASALRDAAFVLALDNDPETLANFRLNVELNGLRLSGVSNQPSAQEIQTSFADISEFRSTSGGPNSEIHMILSDGLEGLRQISFDLIFANLLAPHIETLFAQMRAPRFAAPGNANRLIGGSSSPPLVLTPASPLLIGSGLLAEEWPALRQRWAERYGLTVEREVFRDEWMAFAGRFMA